MNDSLIARCRRCFIDEAAADASATLLEWIEQIPADEKADEAVYAARLVICDGCERLNGAMCRACGCFTAYRAARLTASCPEGKWG